MAQTTVDVVLSVIDRLTRPITAIQNRINRLTAPVHRVGRALGDLGRSAGIDRLAGRLHGVTTALGGVTREAGAALGQLTALAGVSLAGVTASLYNVLRTGGDFERFEIMLTGLFDGDSSAARAALAWSEEFAKTTNLGVDEAIQAYIKLKSVGIDPTLGSLQALTDYNSKMGGGFFELEGVITAINQMWGKQKISAEEMGQLIERNVPAWQLLSRATGKSVEQLMKLSETGNLGPDFIRALLTQMQRESEGASERIAGTWDGIIDRIADTWKSFNNSIADAGVFDEAKASLETLLATVQRLTADGTLQAWAKSVSDAMTHYLVDPLDEFLFGRTVMMEGLEEPRRVGGFVSDLPQHMATLSEAAGHVADSFRAFHDVVSPVVDLVGGNLNAALLTLAAITFGPLIASLLTLSGAVIMFGTALLTTPVGWFLGAIALVAGAVYVIYRNWDGIAEYFSGVWERIKGITDGGIAGIVGALVEFSPGTHVMRGFNALVEYLTGINLYDVGAAIVARLGEGFATLDAILAGWEAKLFDFGVGLVSSMWDGIKSLWGALKADIVARIEDLTSWMPDWARTRLGFDIEAASPKAPEAPAAPSVDRFVGAVPVGATVAQRAPEPPEAPAVPTVMNFVGLVPVGGMLPEPKAPIIQLPEIVVPALPAVPALGAPSSTSSITTSTVDASSVSAASFEVAEPIIAHEPQVVNAPFSASITIHANGLTAQEAGALFDRRMAAAAAQHRANVLSALED